MSLLTLIALFIAAIAIGVFAVVFGGTMFLSFPLFQLMFPALPLASIVGCIKFGSVLRNAAAAFKLWQRNHIDFHSLTLIVPLGLGSIIGAYFVTDFSFIAVPFVLTIAWTLSEFSDRIRVSSRYFFTGAFLVGVYGGIFGAGIMLLIIALLQVRNHTLVNARANAVVLEMLLSLAALTVFLWYGFIVWEIALVWAAGGIIGGYLGGIIIDKTGKLQKRKQQWLIRAAFAFALGVAIWSLL